MEPRAEYRRNITLINTMNEMIICFRQQNYNRAERLFPAWSQMFSQTMEVLFVSKDYFNQYGSLVNELDVIETMKGILQAQEQGDYILLADLLELQLLPFLYSVQEVIRQSEGGPIADDYFEANLRTMTAIAETTSKNTVGTESKHIESAEPKDAASIETEDIIELADDLRTLRFDSLHYIIEDTNQGCPTLKCVTENQSCYLHSNNDPVVEGLLLAKEYYKEELDHYTVYGLGLAYHIEALQQLCDQTSRIDVYESDLQVICAAFTYRNLTPLLQGGVRIYYDPDLTKMMRMLQKYPNGIMLHAPSIRGIRHRALQNSMHELFVQESSVRNQSADMFRNYRSNIQQCKLYVDILREQFKGKSVYLIAAGPSLDKNLIQLKQKPENAIIMAVGTTYRKLMQLGIRPDCVVFLDAAARMYVQATGYEHENIPYLMASTACRKIAADYHGPKYLICQEGYPAAEKYAQEHGGRIYQSGGSVSTIAMDVALRLGAARLICLGLDLAYTGNKMHATCAGKYDMIETDDLLRVRDWEGHPVQTSAALDMYRKWIEKRVETARRETPEVELINATEGGAYIHGMQHIELAKVLGTKFEKSN